MLIDCIEEDQRIIIFCSDVQLKILGSTSKIGADGTFDICPGIFEQFYIIMAWYKVVVLPTAFVLLSGKKESTYRRMLSELKKAVLSIKMEFGRKRVVRALTIINAKNTYLQSNQQFEDLENLLNNYWFKNFKNDYYYYY